MKSNNDSGPYDGSSRQLVRKNEAEIKAHIQRLLQCFFAKRSEGSQKASDPRLPQKGASPEGNQEIDQ